MKTLSLSRMQIERKIGELTETYSDFNNKSANCQKRQQELSKKKAIIHKNIESEKSALYKRRYEIINEANSISVGFIGSLFGNEKSRKRDHMIEMSDKQTKANINNVIEIGRIEINKIIAEMNKKYILNGNKVTQASYWHYMRYNAILTREKLVALRKLLKQEKNIDKLTELKAQAASSRKKTRSLAPSVRKRIAEQFSILNICPYCGQQIDKETAHADHIYPVSKGGHSSIKNMVFICSTCNLSKGEKTLNQYITTVGHDRKFIEKNLSLLNKDY